MGTLQDILQKRKEYTEWLRSIDMEALKRNYTWEELESFSIEWRGMASTSFNREVHRITKEKKEEAFPELLGVHRYPVLKEIDFLSEEEKIALDKYLVRFVPHNEYIFHFDKVLGEKDNERKEKQLIAFLVEKGVLEKHFVLYCPSCEETPLSRTMDIKTKERIQLWMKEEVWNIENLDKYLYWVCDECETDIAEVPFSHYPFQPLLKLTMAQDTKWEDFQ